MTPRGQLEFRTILKILNACATGYAIESKEHLQWIRYGGKKATLPLGPHGRRENYRISRGHVKKMVRDLLIGECVQKYFPSYGLVSVKSIRRTNFTEGGRKKTVST